MSVKENCLGVMSTGVCAGCEDTLECLKSPSAEGLTEGDKEILREAAPPKKVIGFPVPCSQPCGKHLV